jgi:hypothetical protein
MRTHRGDRSHRLNRRQLLGAGAAGAALLGVASSPAGLLGSRVSAAQDQAALRFWVPPGSPIYCEVHQEIAADYAAQNQAVRF